MNMQKTRLNKAKKNQLPLRKAGTKIAPPDLAEFIRLANLVPEGEWLPPVGVLLPNLDGLTPEVKPPGSTWGELLERIQDLPEAVRAELIKASRQVEPTPEELTWISLEGWRFSEVLRHYEQIRVAYNNLRGLASRAESLDPLSQLLQALGRADLSYLRRCAKAGCENIFYAGKHTQKGCSDTCSNAIRQQRKRDRDRENRQNKKKRTTPARKRR
jgi:hypothetical protein